MPTRFIATTLCLTLTLGFAPPAAALRVGQESSGFEELKPALSSPAGLEEPLAGLKQAVGTWQRRGLITRAQRVRLLNVFRNAENSQDAGVGRRRQFLVLLGALLQQMTQTGPRPILSAASTEHNAIHIRFLHEEITYVAALRMRFVHHPTVRIEISQENDGRAWRPIGAARLGTDSTWNVPHLDLADSSDAKSWVHHESLKNVWSESALHTFMNAFHTDIIQPLLLPAPRAEPTHETSLKTGLEERPMTPPPVSPPEAASAGQPGGRKTGGGVTAAEAVAHAKRIGGPQHQLDGSFLTIRPLRPGQSSLHLGSGPSGLPVAEGLFGLDVDLVDLSKASSIAAIKDQYDRYREKVGRSGTMSIIAEDIRTWLPRQPADTRWDHIVMIDVLTASPQVWTTDDAEILARALVGHLVPGGTILISGLGREIFGGRIETAGNAASWVNTELKTRDIPFTKREVTDRLPPGTADTELWLFTIAPLQAQIHAMLDRVVTGPGEAAPRARRAPVYQIVSQEVANRYRGLAVLAELGHYILIDRGAETVAQIPPDVETADYYGSDADRRRFGLALAQANHALTFVRRDPDAETLALLLRRLLATLGDTAPDVVAQRVDVDLLARWLEQAA